MTPAPLPPSVELHPPLPTDTSPTSYFNLWPLIGPASLVLFFTRNQFT